MLYMNLKVLLKLDRKIKGEIPMRVDRIKVIFCGAGKVNW